MPEIGRQTLDYLKMRGDIDLGSHKLLTTNLLLKEYDSTTIAVRNRADTAFRSIWVDTVYPQYVSFSKYSSGYIDTYGSATGFVAFRSFNGSAYIINLKLIGGYVEIYQGKLTSSLDANDKEINNVAAISGRSVSLPLVIQGLVNAANAGDAVKIQTKDSLDALTDRVVIGGGVDTPDVDIVNAYLDASAKGLATYKDEADYGGGFLNYTPPTGKEGLIVLARDTNATTPGWRLYAYFSDGWHYVDLT